MLTHLIEKMVYCQDVVAKITKNQYTIGHMSLIRFMVLLALGTALAWAAWVLVIIRLNPYSDGIPALILFFGSAAIAIAGTLTIAGFFIRYWLEREQVIFRQFAVASRQAMLVTGGAVIIGILQVQGMLRFWSAGLVALFVIILELFIQAGTYRRVAHSHEGRPI